MKRDTIYYFARRQSRWHLTDAIELPRDWAKIDRPVMTWPHIGECRIVFPNTIPCKLRKGQFVNPAKLLRAHLAQKGE